MPHKTYRHACEHGRRQMPACPECGAPGCHGDGVRPTLPWPEVEALRGVVLQRYPDMRSPRKEEDDD